MIQFYSTKNKNLNVSLKDAVLSGLAEDGGLFMPHHIPSLPDSFFKRIDALSFLDISFEVCKALLQNAISEKDLRLIIEKSVTFDAPLKNLSSGMYSLELFNGPTLSFKDFGASFMSHLLAYFLKEKGQTLHILVATSGDTGSAMGQAFLHMPGIQVYILYPKAKVSWSQEKQLTTIGHNITALEIEGTFDDCQRLVKQAFSDPLLRQKLTLVSANSINIGRLIPQTFYYFYAYAQLKEKKLPVVFSVPCGNFGNLTAGLFAQKMGLPVTRFVAATNLNDSVPRYLRSGVFEPRPSVHTLSNAMDVGYPNNFARMLDLYDHVWEKMSQNIFGASFTDVQTEDAIREVFRRYGYLLDPHGAVAYLGLESFLRQCSKEAINGIFLETAHPAKFADSVEPIIQQKLPLPDRLKEALFKEKQTILLEPHYEAFRNLLLRSV